ncbi:MAG: lamin tail domain-containing protein, partial [Anaerolineae bacterium]|nr:lamin tail domain-containing protein [Anaerolineae bacterium]
MSTENPESSPALEPVEESTQNKLQVPRTRRKPRKSGDLPQLVMYILVNILISAATMLGVLFFWEARQPEPIDCVPTIAPEVQTVVQATALPTIASIPPLEQEVIRIEVIYGAEYLQDERVVLQRVGTSDLPMYGWYLEDEDGNRFQFPGITLKPGAELQIYSRSGDSTVLALFWGASRSIWSVGETARVYDPQGNLRAEYMIP